MGNVGLDAFIRGAGSSMNWKPLTRLGPCHGEPQHYEFLFPLEDTPRRPTYWKDLLVDVVEWLFENEFLKPSHCPIKRQGAPIRYLVHTEPRPGVYVETKDNDDRLVENATIIIEQVAPSLLDEFLFRGTA